MSESIPENTTKIKIKLKPQFDENIFSPMPHLNAASELPSINIETLSESFKEIKLETDNNHFPTDPTKKIEQFQQLPKYKQGSIEWLNQRQNYLTASTIYTALGKAGKSARKHLLIEKGSNGKISYFSGNLATQHGNKCEPIANDIYCYKNNVIVHEFGMITNERYPILGVSPDGILTDRMLEIKCPITRKIDGVVKKEYYHQMQEQMAVCEYDTCDFLECKIDFVNEQRFFTDFDYFDQFKGAIIFYIKEIEGECKYGYLYSPLNLSIIELRKWIQDTCANIIDVSISYWVLSKYNCQVIKRDPDWIVDSYPTLQQFWNEVEHLRENGIDEDYIVSSEESDNETATSVSAINISTVCLI